MRTALITNVVMATAAATAATKPRFVVYMDQYHTTGFPDKSTTAGVNYVITAFANSSLFTPEGGKEAAYEPFMPLDKVRAMFDDGAKVCMAIGGWGDTAGLSEGSKTPESCAAYAKAVASTAERLGYDCVDIDWEYPGGNGDDYKQITNSEKESEIEAYPTLLEEIKKALGDKELSIAVPGLERDMIAYTLENVPKINAVVDFVNVMSYDFMNRRDSTTKHHSDVNQSLAAVDTYIARGMEPSKLNLGLAFYAKWFTTQKGAQCGNGLGCATEPLEADDGSDTAMSGTMTFEKANLEVVKPGQLVESPDLTCGTGTNYKCPGTQCCSQYGSCGATTEYCGGGCQPGFGTCADPDAVSLADSFQAALKGAQTDEDAGGEYYWDVSAGVFWTWDTPALIARKFADVVAARGLGGVMAWSLAEDSYDWSHLKAMQTGYAAMAGAQ